MGTRNTAVQRERAGVGSDRGCCVERDRTVDADLPASLLQRAEAEHTRAGEMERFGKVERAIQRKRGAVAHDRATLRATQRRRTGCGKGAFGNHGIAIIGARP